MDGARPSLIEFPADDHYFTVTDLPAAIGRVQSLGGSIIHPGDTTAICKDSEGTPFGLIAT